MTCFLWPQSSHLTTSSTTFFCFTQLLFLFFQYTPLHKNRSSVKMETWGSYKLLYPQNPKQCLAHSYIHGENRLNDESLYIHCSINSSYTMNVKPSAYPMSNLHENLLSLLRRWGSWILGGFHFLSQITQLQSGSTDVLTKSVLFSLGLSAYSIFHYHFCSLNW